MPTGRALHYVFRIADRKKSAYFYREILGMKFLRHEEFQEACGATCNGPYDGRWSKEMVGYGSEDTHFVIELTYNYGVKSYEMGNDFQGITIFSKSAFNNVKTKNWPVVSQEGAFVKIACPDGYFFYIHDVDVSGDPVQMWSLSVTNLQKSIEYWNDLLEMPLMEKKDNYAVLCYKDSPNKCALRLVEIEEKINRGTYFGRTAFSCPAAEQEGLQAKMEAAKQTILVPYIRLDTPGKQTVSVIILADPDGHEICFVEDEGFRKLSQIDPTAEEELDKAMANDHSRD